MKRILLFFLMVTFSVNGFGQSISKITIAGNGQIDVIAFGLDERVEVYLTKEGSIVKWGFDKYIGYQENYTGTLDPYVGRVEYYSQNDDASIQGKVKYIGKTLLTYYASYENKMLKGKLKSIGNINLDYYLEYADDAFKGFIKNIGQHTVTWYASYENKDLRGKLKSVGPTTFLYYGSFEDKAFRGKIKSIDRFGFTYYSSLEQYSGSVKTGSQIVNANGIKYFVRNY